ncbi:hypothetical protein E2C01_090457 [Portunus trituberculatus]|uniref:Uncharacterized protein n=1 Tax=Portunus trituberculatus TaxID=210409 RepID=A0A5B7JKY4_PORTR|nr:hypothetical protein [Portunus trituberculatus]
MKKLLVLNTEVPLYQSTRVAGILAPHAHTLQCLITGSGCKSLELSVMLSRNPGVRAKCYISYTCTTMETKAIEN